MTKTIEVQVPNIGDAVDVDVIEISVSEGDFVKEGDSLITLESDKASMDVPAPQSGTVTELKLQVGDKVSEGGIILTMETDNEPAQHTEALTSEQKEEVPKQAQEETVPSMNSSAGSTLQKTVEVPDIGDAKGVDVIEISVAVGDKVTKDQPLITLEGDKATMEIPSPYEGKVTELCLDVGSKVSQGAAIVVLEVDAPEQAGSPTQVETPSRSEPNQAAVNTAPALSPEKVSTQVSHEVNHTARVYASPAVRRLAREFGVDLTLVNGTGRKARILKEDVQAYVKARLAQPETTLGLGLPKTPAVDFSKYGEVEAKPLNKIKRITAQNMQRAWLTVPQVTQFDEADVTELEQFRKAQKEQVQAQDGIKLTPLAFITKAVAKALLRFPQFNASLDETGEHLIYKKYINIGIAVDTPNGLVVPVIKEAGDKSVVEIAADMAALSEKARKKALMPDDMSGGSFTISSLGGIGGTAFTPIVNLPEVAILGVSRTKWQPVYNGKEFLPRLMLPLSLTYDHRVIDGAEAARFTNYLSQLLTDIRMLLL